MDKPFTVGEIVTYEYKNGNGQKYVCTVVEIRDDWILDSKHGTFESNSFRANDVIIWERKPGKKK